jgi:nucleoside-diphosphate-sugar epimerase
MDERQAMAGFDGVRVLITGGLGFLGSNLARRLAPLGARVTLIDSLEPNQGGLLHNAAGIEDRVAIEIGDLRDAALLERVLPGQEVIFNLAGQTSHLDSMHDPQLDMELNCRAQLSLLEAWRRLAAEARVVFASTRQIYGRPDYLPVDEAHPLRPVDINGVHKLAGETYHRLYGEVYDLKAVVLRLTNTYGPRMRIKDARQTFLGVWIRAALEGRPFEVWGGAQLRDFSYVDDVTRAMLLAAATPEAFGEVFNLAGSPPASLLETAEILAGLTGGGFEVRAFPAERQRIDIGDYHADDRKFRALTGWSPQVGLAEGLGQTLGYFREQLKAHL